MTTALAPVVDPSAPADELVSSAVVSAIAQLMGGLVGVHLRPAGDPDRARRDASRTLRRIGSWADRLTRFTTTSELSLVNADPATTVRVSPLLGAVLGQALDAGRTTNGIVDATLLGARLAAEASPGAAHVEDEPFPWAGRPWTIDTDRRGGVVARRPGVRFDLDGVAKGWIADRAAAGLEAHPAVVVDADGDLAISLAFGQSWHIGIADPRTAGADLATVEVTGLDPGGRDRLGLATSGTIVHRWVRDGTLSHHLIDPRTGRPAVTDVIQATVLADSASAAEIAAKTIVILGSARSAALMDRPGIRAVIVLTDRDEVLASPSALRWLS